MQAHDDAGKPACPIPPPRGRPARVGFRNNFANANISLGTTVKILLAPCVIAFVFAILMPYDAFCFTHRWWAQQTIPGLTEVLKEEVQGQPVAIDKVSSSINIHLRYGYTPSNPLSFVFHGGTGTGKNFMSQIVANHLSEKGMASKYVHLWDAAKLFSDSMQKTKYQKMIRKWVNGNITACPYQLFIFDEVDKMPNGTLNIMTSFLNHNPPTQDGIDYRRAIYIFISNAGGKLIHNKAMEYHKAGIDRADMKMDDNDMDKDLFKEALERKGGLKDTSILKQHLVSHFVPFLPLEASHVRQCVYNSLLKTHEGIRPGVDQEKLVDEVMSDIEFLDGFSTWGCKSAEKKTNHHFERRRQRNNAGN